MYSGCLSTNSKNRRGRGVLIVVSTTFLKQTYHFFQIGTDFCWRPCFKEIDYLWWCILYCLSYNKVYAMYACRRQFNLQPQIWYFEISELNEMKVEFLSLYQLNHIHNSRNTYSDIYFSFIHELRRKLPRNSCC